MLEILFDILRIVMRGLERLSTKEFLYTMIVGGSLSVATVFVAWQIIKLWNRSYKLTIMDNAVTTVSAILTFLLVLMFVGITDLQEISKKIVEQWKEQIIHDQYFLDDSFVKAYNGVKELGIEDFTNYPSPVSGGHLIPVDKDESKLLSGKIYTEEAMNNFKDVHRFLSVIFELDDGNAPDIIKKDIERQFSEGNTIYSVKSAIEIASSLIEKGLIKQAPKTVIYARAGFIAIYIMIQLIVIGMISIFAYRKLKIHF